MPDADAVISMGISLPLNQGINRRIIVDAAEWLVKLHAHEMTHEDHAALERWRKLSAEHERAWIAANDLTHIFHSVPPPLGKATLGRPRDRRTTLKTLGLLAMAAPAGWIGWRAVTRDRYQTAAGEWQQQTLADGSVLRLNSGSTVNIAYGNTERLLHLQEGEILFETAPDHINPPRPFLVRTSQGTIRALGTRFIVRQRDGNTEVSVLEHAVEILTHNHQRHILQAGETTYFDGNGIAEAHAIDFKHTAWTQGILIADNQRLADFLEELSRYRTGILRCDASVASLRISGVFQLTDTDHALAILQETLPITLHQRTRYWTTISASESKIAARKQ